MKRADLRKNHVIVVSTLTYDKAYLVDYVGQDKVAVTLIAGRTAGCQVWVAGYSETQIEVLDGDGSWMVLGDIATGRLVRSIAEWARREWASAQARAEERDLAQAEANRLANILAEQEHAAHIAEIGGRVMTDANYDADSNLPLGWRWCVRDWPEGQDLMTARGPRDELMARYKGRPCRVGVVGDEPFVEAVERALAAKDRVSA